MFTIGFQFVLKYFDIKVFTNSNYNSQNFFSLMNTNLNAVYPHILKFFKAFSYFKDIWYVVKKS